MNDDQKAESLIQDLPKIISKGKKVAQRIIDGISESNRITLQINELVLPTKAESGLSQYFGQSIKEIQDKELFNRIIYGDNLLAMPALLAGNPLTGLPSMRGKIDLIYIDPPFDSKADYRIKIHLTGTDIEQQPNIIEQFAYSDTWKNGTSSYLEMIIPRLILMRELLSERGSIYVQIDWHVGHYVKVILDEIFGKDNFINEIIWRRTFAHGDIGQGAKHLGRLHDLILLYGKTKDYILNNVYLPYEKDYIEKHFTYIDEKTGRKFQSVSLTAPGGAAKGNPNYEFLGIKRYWQYSKENMQKLLDEGRIYQSI